METREYKGRTPGLRPGRRWLVRWVDVPLVCAGCMRALEIKRYMADVLCIIPFIVAAICMVVFDSTAFLWIIGIYGLYLFKWAWGLGYVWSDAVLYGAGLETTLKSFTPLGDRGTVRFPSGLWHCLVRLGWLPALFIVLGMVMNLFAPHSGADKSNNATTATETASPEPKEPEEPLPPESSDPKERAKAKSAREMAAAKKFLKNAHDIAVPVDPATGLMKKDTVVDRKDMDFYTVYAKAENAPEQTNYQLATGPQMLAMFLKTKGHDVDFLRIAGPNLPLSRWQAVKIAAELPAADPPTTPALKR